MPIAEGRIKEAVLKEQEPMKEGELIVRFFGMKDDDSTLHVAMKVIQGISPLR